MVKAMRVLRFGGVDTRRLDYVASDTPNGRVESATVDAAHARQP
jgi:hypothetical protein